ncbi:MAG: Ig-like domain-containing protein [Ignavibacteriales bacterium]|nr:Ig-like domain-containing protein [Ignavibacteriales bacterium]
MKQHIIFFLGITVFITFSCKGPEGPAGHSGNNSIESLTDPSVQPSVIYTNPPANSVGPYTDFNSTIMLRFNKIMDHNSIRRNVKLYSSIGNIFADTNSFRTIGGDVYTFNAVDSLGQNYSNRWNIGQVCSLKIRPGARDINGNTMMQRYIMTFLPEPMFRVKNINPPSSASNVNVSSSFDIYFNSAVDSSIFPHIHISPPLVGDWFINYYSDSTQTSFNHLQLLEPGTIYYLSIDSLAMDKRGNKLQNIFTSTFYTEPFRATTAYPENGSTNVSPLQLISIGLNGIIDTNTVRGAFSISPSLEGYFIMGGINIAFIPTSVYTASTKYTVTLSTTLGTKSGKHLVEPYIFSFTTGY